MKKPTAPYRDTGFVAPRRTRWALTLLIVVLFSLSHAGGAEDRDEIEIDLAEFREDLEFVDDPPSPWMAMPPDAEIGVVRVDYPRGRISSVVAGKLVKFQLATEVQRCWSLLGYRIEAFERASGDRVFLVTEQTYCDDQQWALVERSPSNGEFRTIWRRWLPRFPTITGVEYLRSRGGAGMFVFSFMNIKEQVQLLALSPDGEEIAMEGVQSTERVQTADGVVILASVYVPAGNADCPNDVNERAYREKEALITMCDLADASVVVFGPNGVKRFPPIRVLMGYQLGSQGFPIRGWDEHQAARERVRNSLVKPNPE